jgi:hypothetical protein
VELVERRRWPRVVGVLLLVVLLLVVAGITWWVLSYPETETVPVAAVRSDPALQVLDEGGVVTLHPAEGPGDEAVVFYPGGAVAPEAYLATWAPVVRDTGVSVHIPRMPLRLAVLRPGRAAAVVDANPDVQRWWLSGHSLGGAMAASHVGGSDPGTYEGLLLWAAYATEGAALAERDDLVVVSISGSEDGLSTPADIRERAALLPASTTFVELDGVSHAQFGTYGPQSGDGTPTVSAREARAAIAEATVDALSSLDRDG